MRRVVLLIVVLQFLRSECAWLACNALMLANMLAWVKVFRIIPEFRIFLFQSRAYPGSEFFYSQHFGQIEKSWSQMKLTLAMVLARK